MERISGGRFGLNNQTAKSGGVARGRKLSAERKREIGRKGYATRVRKLFGGDKDAAADYMRELGTWSYERQADVDNMASRSPHPGTPREFMARRFQLNLFTTGDHDHGV